jgi:hypothetical protein
MDSEKPMSEQESLALITQMIHRAKCDYEDTGISALMWGIVITFCSLVAFAGWMANFAATENIWLLTIVAVVVQVIVSVRERKRKKYSSYEDTSIGGIWISFGIAIFMVSFYSGKLQPHSPVTIFLILYGIPTFATGFSKNFRPMVIGGIACWVFAVASMYTPFPYAILYGAAAAQLAWFIPGLILRRKYLKAKNGNV